MKTTARQKIEVELNEAEQRAVTINYIYERLEVAQPTYGCALYIDGRGDLIREHTVTHGCHDQEGVRIVVRKATEFDIAALAFLRLLKI